MIFIETLVYVIKDDRVLLIKKKKGLGTGYYNGVGGKVEEHEDIVTGAVRECMEEVGIKPRNMEWRGLLEFWNYEDNMVESVHFVHVFIARDFDGEPKESDEAEPIWFSIDNIPFNNMWEDDKLWLPKVLSGRKVYGRFTFEKWKMINGEVYELSNA